VALQTRSPCCALVRRLFGEPQAENPDSIRTDLVEKGIIHLALERLGSPRGDLDALRLSQEVEGFLGSCDAADGEGEGGGERTGTETRSKNVDDPPNHSGM
jgi:hypothetical protein